MDNLYVCEFTMQPMENSLNAIICNNQTKDEINCYVKII